MSNLVWPREADPRCLARRRIGIEHPEEGVEVARTGGGEEGVDQLPLTRLSIRPLSCTRSWSRS